MISLEGLEGKLFFGLNTLLAQLGDFARENCFWGRGWVDTVCFDGDDDTTADFKEEMGVKADNTGLIRLRNVLSVRISYAGKETVASMQLTANIQSTIETSMRYLSGCRASSASLLVI